MFGGEFGEYKHDGRCVVVHGDGGFGAGERADEPFAVGVTAAARERFGIVFQSGVAAYDLVHGSCGLFRKDAAP